MSSIGLVVNAIIALAIIVGYIVLTALGDDGTPLLGLLAGQGIAIAGAKGADAATKQASGG